MGLIEKETGLLQFTGLIDGDQWIHYSWKENKLPSSWLTFIAFPLWEGKESKLVCTSICWTSIAYTAH